MSTDNPTQDSPRSAESVRPTNPWQGGINRRLERLEDELLRLKLREHRHDDLEDGYQGAYVRGFQDGFRQCRRELLAFEASLGNQPIPNPALIDGEVAP